MRAEMTELGLFAVSVVDATGRPIRLADYTTTQYPETFPGIDEAAAARKPTWGD
jgi:hypothetical protein